MSEVKRFRGEDLTGQRFGRLTVRERAEKPAHISDKTRGIYWRCDCQCGGSKIVLAYNLKQGNVKSCGCIKAEADKRRAEQIKARQIAARDARKRKMQGGGIVIKDSALGRDIRTCKCACCGKVFERLSSDWVYKETSHAGKHRYYCSWGCMRDAKRPKRHGNCKPQAATEG